MKSRKNRLMPILLTILAFTFSLPSAAKNTLEEGEEKIGRFCDTFARANRGESVATTSGSITPPANPETDGSPAAGEKRADGPVGDAPGWLLLLAALAYGTIKKTSFHNLNKKKTC